MERCAFCEKCGQLSSLVFEPGSDAMCPRCFAKLSLGEGEDVFISFNFGDMEYAQKVAAHLAEAGIRFWLAPLDERPGDDFAKDIPAALDVARVVVLLLSRRAAESDWVRKEINYADKLHIPIIQIRLEDFKPPRDLAFVLGTRIYEDVTRRALPEILDRVVNQIQRKLREAVATVPLRLPPAPMVLVPSELLGVNRTVDRYVGPEPFGEDDVGIFFGRDEEAKYILEQLESRSVAVLAPSGAGKSSLINTVVREALLAAGVQVLRGGRLGVPLPAELDQEKKVFNRLSLLVNCGLAKPSQLNPSRSLTEQLRAMSRSGDEGRRVLLLDQFEESFTRDDFEDRPGFFEDLGRALEEDPKLRLILAMRQEYQANFEEHAEGMRETIRPRKVRLGRLGDVAACDVITRPVAEYVTFAPGVAEEIVRQLKARKVTLTDGTVVRRPGEFVELVHLQIVCRRLWEELEPGKKRIERQDLQVVAGENKSFEDFVDNVLEAFVKKTVATVAREKNLPERMIQLGLTRFVRTTGARVTIWMDEARGRTGRLPNDVVARLEAAHLLRAETRGDDRWYELSHDLLVEPIKATDRSLAALLTATELLSTMLQKVRGERGGTLVDYFNPHPEILVECEPFEAQTGLFEDEVEFLFRASLGGGQHMEAWSRRLAVDAPARQAVILIQALASPTDSVCANAATALGLVPVPALEGRLVDLAIGGSELVRSAAAVSIARLDKPALYDGLTAKLDDREIRIRAVGAWAVVLSEGERLGARELQRRFRDIGLGDRFTVRTASWGFRLRQHFAMLFYFVIPAAVLSGLGAGLFKWLPTWQNVGITQPKGNPVMGFYQGFVAGSIWGGLISLSLTFHHILFGREYRGGSTLRPALALPFATLAGGLSGMMVTFVILGVYQVPTLVDMHWIRNGVTAFSHDFFHEVFFETRFGWAFPISGSFLGLGIALTINAVRSSSRWIEFVREQKELTSINQIATMLKGIAAIALPRAWPILGALVIAGSVAGKVVKTELFSINAPTKGATLVADSSTTTETPFVAAIATRDECEAVAERRRRRDPAADRLANNLRACSHLTDPARDPPVGGVWGLLAECGCQVTGGFGVVVGMGLGLVLLRKGINIRGMG